MFFNSIEFYVILFVSAALIVGLIAIPRGSGPVKEFLVGSRLMQGEESEPSIEVDCDNFGNVILTRHGLNGIRMDGAVSAKIEVKGERITVSERLVMGGRDPEAGDATSAQFTLDFLAADRYYLRYESEATATATSLSFRNTPGYHAGPAALVVNS